MVDVRSKRCEEPGCGKQPRFGIEGEKCPTRCATHRTKAMVNVVHKCCKSSWCSTLVSTTRYEGYCLYCFVNLFPDKPVSRNYKVKEQTVVDLIKENLDPTFAALFPPVFDRRVDMTACGSGRKPDVRFDLLTHVLLVEVDENQHKGKQYGTSCENKRCMELFQDFGERAIVMIRFNPDSFVRDGVRHPSSFQYTKTGLCRIRDAEEWKSRYETLMDAINHQLRLTSEENRTPDKTFNEIKLFYDQ